jgi:Ni/Fe-hydrogenase subunit HybB-like protein
MTPQAATRLADPGHGTASHGTAHGAGGHDPHEAPLGGRILTPAFKLLLFLAACWAIIAAFRIFLGLGAVSAQSDGYAWGIWKPLNVVTFTGIAAGAFSVGLLTYAFNKGEYHPLVRSAVMAGAMGYTLAGTSVLIDLGRWWNLWVVFFPPVWNLNSVLLEVAICVMAYTLVLWVEITPSVLERLEASPRVKIAVFAGKALPVMRKVLPFVISLAILLPTMHQSSLGYLYGITLTKTHPFWHSYWLSGLFLVSCLTMGFGAVVVLENLLGMVYGKKVDQPLLARLSAVAGWLVVGYLALRLGDLALRFRDPDVLARYREMGSHGFYGFFLLLEHALFAAPLAVLLRPRARANRGHLFLAGATLLAAGALYRFDTYLTSYQPAPGWTYFPTLTEMLFSAGLGAVGVLVYVLFVKLFPILSGVRRDAAAR